MPFGQRKASEYPSEGQEASKTGGIQGLSKRQKKKQRYERFKHSRAQASISQTSYNTRRSDFAELLQESATGAAPGPLAQCEDTPTEPPRCEDALQPEARLQNSCQRRSKAAKDRVRKPVKRPKMALVAGPAAAKLADRRAEPIGDPAEHSFVTAAEAAAAALACAAKAHWRGDASGEPATAPALSAPQSSSSRGAAGANAAAAVPIEQAREGPALSSALTCAAGPAAFGAVGGMASGLTHHAIGRAAAPLPPRPASRFGRRPALQAPAAAAAPLSHAAAGHAERTADTEVAGESEGLPAAREAAYGEQPAAKAASPAAPSQGQPPGGSAQGPGSVPPAWSRRDLSASAAVISASLRSPPRAPAGAAHAARGSAAADTVGGGGPPAGAATCTAFGRGQPGEAGAVAGGGRTQGGAGPGTATRVQLPAGEQQGRAEEGGGEGADAAQAPAQERRRHAAVHGNYRRYYGYRLGQSFEGDPRLQVMERWWFHRRRCLDIGCNEGLVTLAAAARFGAASMLGVDLDEHLIRNACRHAHTLHLREQRTQAAARAAALKRPGAAHAASAEAGEGATASTDPATQRTAAAAAARALKATHFQLGDFLDLDAPAPGSLDTVLCLSVTKWVHLHRGDAGLAALFARVAAALALGGLLVLEPQPWRSYQAAVSKLRRAGVAVPPLDSLQLRPEALPEYLAAEHGLRLLKRLQVGAAAPGFDRPLLVFQRER